MKKALRMIASIEILFHFEAGEKKTGPCSGLIGDCSGLIGNCSGLSGDCSDLSGDCSGLIGNCSGLRGNCSGLIGDCSDLRGNLDECELADQEREAGIDIASLVAPDPDGDEKGLGE